MQYFLETMLPFIGVLVFGGLIFAVVLWYGLTKIRLLNALRRTANARTEASRKNIDAVTAIVAELAVNSHRYFDMPDGIKKELYEAHQAVMELDK